MTFTVVVSVAEAVVADVVVTVEESAGDTDGPCDEAPDAESEEGIADDVSVPELITEGEEAGVEVDAAVEDTELEEDTAEELLAPAPAPSVTLVKLALYLVALWSSRE